MGRWLWPLGVFVAALLGGTAVAAIAVRAVTDANLRRDSMLYHHLLISAGADTKNALHVIEAAQRGDIATVLELSCLSMRGDRARMAVVLRGSVDPGAYDAQMRDVDAKIATLKREGKCGH